MWAWPIWKWMTFCLVERRHLGGNCQWFEHFAFAFTDRIIHWSIWAMNHWLFINLWFSNAEVWFCVFFWWGKNYNVKAESILFFYILPFMYACWSSCSAFRRWLGSFLKILLKKSRQFSERFFGKGGASFLLKYYYYRSNQLIDILSYPSTV